MANIAAPLPIINSIYPSNKGAMALGDDPLGAHTPYKTISGRVYDTNGASVPGATVMLFRQSDNFMCATTISGGLGVYVFQRRSDDTNTYYTVAYSIAGGSTQIHGASDRGMVPV